ncbi:FAD-dependent oxidoreductase [Hymenobacter sp. GOD-10R]|uniref:FAD-dependent oxidoreductase n=1 Tax=Hymenobacter sp. GOD-10R TaxID=3093922 RepID=UPI002D7A0162|nr:FAD-dependent oxidoreductase [Hymenobacter sp. GOD-10R]WRQ29074.1 FAD-dependent oxidoreductase [Hymenobacter sp. GOD-10R]
MKETSASTQPSWLHTAPSLAEFPALTENITADVVVVGAGIAGLTTAYLLAREGRNVVVLESGKLGSGETGRTTAHLSNALDDRYTTLEELFGESGARIAAQSHGGAIDLINDIVREEHIACDFARVNGYLFLPKDGDRQELDEELEAAHHAGLTGVRRLSNSPTKGFQTGECLEFPNQGQFHIIKYLHGLVDAITRLGGRIFTHSHVSEVKGGKSASVTTASGAKVTAKAVLVATNTPVNDRVVMHTKQHPYRTYAIAARIPHGSVTKALYWDTPDPYHYIRLEEVPGEPDGVSYDLLLVGGEDHKTGQGVPEESFRCLEEWAREHFPMIESIDYRWSGQVMEPSDSLGYAGRNPLDDENVYIITGDSGHGMTHGTLGAMIVADLIQGRQTPWEELYDPGRVTFRPTALKEFIVENVNVAAEYTDLLTGGDVSQEEEIKPGSGAVLRRGLTKVAVYRDPQGQTHTCSAICPHLGCVVHWNGVESSWDCPCHGSRFDAYGHLLNGPSNQDLAAVDES